MTQNSNTTYNIYCDESCHLENDGCDIMVLGALWVPIDNVRTINKEIRNIKQHHGLSESFEIKWTKVSSGKIGFYLDLVNFFFEQDDMSFRALIAKNKHSLKHEEYFQNHDDWYYKMYYYLINFIISPLNRYRIYLDIKDTCSAKKTKKLHDVLSNSKCDFSRDILERVQTVNSKEVEILQITDLLIGAIGYDNRELAGSESKKRIIDLIKRKSGYSLRASTLLKENKLNLFVWRPTREGNF